jgi:hypothetical protein
MYLESEMKIVKLGEGGAGEVGKEALRMKIGYLVPLFIL